MTFSIDTILEELYSLQRLGIKVGLEHTVQLLNEIGNPHKKLRLVHVAGTNGKGSTCSILTKILIDHGLKVGLYTSPHLKKFNERIKINDSQISDEYIATFFNENKTKINEIEATFFETTTALAFNYFKDQVVDYAVIETGLGGRLDSTNVIIPKVCGITSISLDHTEILGDTVEKIAVEKAGIIKEGVPTFTFEQKPSVLEILKKEADKKNSNLDITAESEIDVIKSGEDGTFFNYSGLEFELHLIGDHQVKNCVLAINIAKKLLGSSFDISTVKKSVKTIKWPGRLEKIKNKNMYYDVAHNVEGIGAMIKTISNSHADKKVVGLFSLKSDKNIKPICNVIKNNFETIILCHDKSGYLSKATVLEKILNENNIKCFCVSSVKKGVEALEKYNDDYVKIIFGSHYIAKEVYTATGKHFDTTNN
jgi:dihydrofolate synthase/folylpolyglutamate synthase